MKTDSSMIPKYILESVDKLSSKQKEKFWAEYNNNSKKILTAYLLWLIGFHHLYLNRFFTQFLYLMTLGGFLIWALFDLLFMPKIISEYNKNAAQEALRTAKLMSGEKHRVFVSANS
jgi:TM2 domain-containing membrane protein YozV